MIALSSARYLLTKYKYDLPYLESIYGNPQDGYFLLRPSTTNVNNPLALVLWYKDKVYNVPVRKRPDNR